MKRRQNTNILDQLGILEKVEAIWPQLQAARPPTLAKWPPIGTILTRTSSSMQRSTTTFNMQPLDPEGQ